MPASERGASSHDWRHHLGAVLWSAFLVASLATTLFFALFDPPLLLRDDAPPSWLADRRVAYTLGFFAFWSMSSLAASLAAWLISTQQVTARLESQRHG